MQRCYRIVIPKPIKILCLFVAVAECHFMICNFYEEFINMLVSEFVDPDKVCEFLTLCP